MSTCRSYVIRTTDADGKVTFELRCFGKCNGEPCTDDYFNPTSSQKVVFRACYCRDDVTEGPPCCNPFIEGAGTRTFKTCRIALVYRFTPEGVPERAAFDVTCIGLCEEPGGGTCQPMVVGSTEFEGIKIEIIRCSCS